jgi:tetratricopeptide (TPR) repeat protein
MDLLQLALSRPREALERAGRVLAGGPTPLEASTARQAIGVVLREYGDIDAAIAELRMSRQLARQARDPQREADVTGTLGVALVFAGRPLAGLRTLDRSVELASGELLSRVVFRRGAVLGLLGRHPEALSDLNRAIAELEQWSDTIWTARGLTERATCYLSLGHIQRAAADLRRAERLFAASGQELESAEAITNLGVLAMRVGDIPSALARFDDAEQRFRLLNTPNIDVVTHRCSALLAGGLFRDAMRVVDEAISGAEQIRCRPTTRAELLLTSSSCALAAGHPDVAADRARQARRLFLRQDRPWWAVRARLAQVQADLACGRASSRLLRQARVCVDDLAALHSPDLGLGQLAVGRVALAQGQSLLAVEFLSAAAAHKRSGPALARARAWLAEALRAEIIGDARRVLRSCQRGLQVLDDYRAVLGSSELRAQATTHGAELAAIGQRQALRKGRPSMLLAWSERWRAVAMDIPSVRPPPDEELQARLAALRAAQVSRDSNTTGTRDEGAGKTVRDRAHLEAAVRARDLHTPGARTSSAMRGAAFKPSLLLDQIGDDRLIELVELDGLLYVLVCGSGKIRRFEVGEAARAAREVSIARFALRRLASRPEALRAQDAQGQLDHLGTSLSEALLGEAVDHLGNGTVVVVPPAQLHAVPWALLPSLWLRRFCVNASATSWLNAGRAALQGDADGPVVLVRGPGLASEGAEVPELARRYAQDSSLIVLEGASATVDRVLQAMDGAWLVHVAAHGTFRADSPLFSSLSLDDGPLTLYDLERLRTGPRHLVLSSCDSGVGAPVGADEILGLASSVLPLGTCSIVCSVVPVNDHAVVPFMVDLHEHLRRGGDLSGALRDSRSSVAGDPLGMGTACSFLALGAC